jgi:hypothetical protein
MIELTRQTFILYSIGIGLAGYVFGLFAAHWSADHAKLAQKLEKYALLGGKMYLLAGKSMKIYRTDDFLGEKTQFFIFDDGTFEYIYAGIEVTPIRWIDVETDPDRHMFVPDGAGHTSNIYRRVRKL